MRECLECTARFEMVPGLLIRRTVFTSTLVSNRLLAATGALLLLVATGLAAPLTAKVVQEPFMVPAGSTPQQKFELAHKASMAGDPAAQCFLGDCYRNGWGCTANGRIALDCFQKSASNGYYRAELKAGNMALELRNFPVAQKWFGVAARRGDAEAQYRFGNLYDAAFKVPGKLTLFKIHLVSNYRSMDWFLDGKKVYPVPVDYNEAAKWYQKAAEQGHPAAQNNLGVMYAFGLGLRADLLEAYKWLRLALHNAKRDGTLKGDGFPMTHNIEALTSHMTPKQVEEANARLAKYNARPS